MTRRFLDDIRDDITNLIADNTSGDITPADIRGTLTDTLDSTVQDEGDIFSTGPTDGVILTGSFTSLATIYDGEGNGSSFVIPDFASGTITGSSTAGFSYSIRSSITVNASNNEEIEFAIGIDGVASAFFATLVGTGTTSQSVSVGAFDRTAGSNVVYTLMARAVDGGATITVDAVRLVTVIHPTNSP